jgi:hypothetical protein
VLLVKDMAFRMVILQIEPMLGQKHKKVFKINQELIIYTGKNQ